MKQKTRVAILFGGKSAEHEVSLQSAKSIIDAIDKEKYDVVLVGIDKQGRWLLSDHSQYLLHADNPKLISLNKSNKDIAVVPGSDTQLVAAHTAKEQLLHPTREGEIEIGSGGAKSISGQITDNAVGQVDVVFPVLHGTYGEDGTMQGLLKMLDIPFVGAGVLGSAVGMDKDVMKRLLRDAGIPIAKFISVRKSDVILNEVKDPEILRVAQNDRKLSYNDIVKQLGLPFFVKPANEGSSVGISKVHNETEYGSALKDAFSYDSKILIEAFIEGREIECSVLGNDDPIASVPGEIVPHHEFYDYEAKYIDEDGAELIIPAKLTDQTTKKVQETALKAFKALCCEGMARIDTFVTKDGDVYLNEINTIPGFTKISMYPKLWAASGISYSELIDRLIQLALERHERDKKLKTSFV